MRAPWIKNYSFDVNLVVSSLIDPISQRWNLPALHEIFVPGDIELIIKRQPVGGKEDFHSWKFNRSGSLTVKSAYWLACDVKTRQKQPQILALPSLNPLKEQAWKIMTTPKIKIFVWKALNEALPVADLINKRGMKVDERCQLCGFEGEDINHVLFSCPFARQVWALSNIPSPPHGFHHLSIFENVNFLFGVTKLQRGDMEFKRAWPWVLWNLWKCRNGLLFEGKRWSPSEIVCKGFGESEEWYLAQIVEKEMESKQITYSASNKIRWSPPPDQWLTCNFASDWNKTTKSLGAAWVVRNDRGVVLFHNRRTFAEISSKEEAKLVTFLWAAESMTSLKLDKLIMAGELEELFGAVLKPHLWPAFGFQRQEIMASMVGIRHWKVQVTRKEANRGAGFIAESVNKFNFGQSYVATGHPEWLFEFFVNESRFL
ncbi:uncharacterized protein LOC103842327 [Brassica rapa]|uniref:uncharacterized protein LOC103842327 n=1 Tax=Brassica campestris TaxID=3711 RepID=UPI0004F1455B|nr:uncharacterized protein LOC103842327 [Brassica rapa]